jgi:tetratricopeptide (TPR) repeat protein
VTLSDPELDLFRELLEEDPGNEAYLTVGKELVKRGDLAEACQVLVNGLRLEPNEEGWALLANTAHEEHLFDLTQEALQKLDKDPVTNQEYARLEVQILGELGELKEALEAAERFLAAHPDDDAMMAQIDDIKLSPQQSSLSTPDPFCSVERAELHVHHGQRERAIRIYRRILFHNPDNKGLVKRLWQLQAPVSNTEEELADPPPGLSMPQTTLRRVYEGVDGDEEPTEEVFLGNEAGNAP